MFDGLKIFYRINDFEAWKTAVNIELFIPTDLETGATKGKIRTTNGRLQQTINYQGDFESYHITVKETTYTDIRGKRSVTYFLIIDGSLHKNHFNGANYLPFTWDKLQKEITKLETGLQLSDKFTQIVNLEIGVNITVPFPAFQFLADNLLLYKGDPFDKYKPNKNGNRLGFVSYRSQYSVKIYDKAKQYNLPYHLMRFELRYLKMQTLKERGIKTLTDLQSQERVNGLLSLLLTAWDNVLLFDSSINPENPELKQRDRQLLNNANNPKFWERMKEKSNRNFNYRRSKFRELVAKYGQGWHNKIKECIRNEWENLFKNCTILPSVQEPKLNKITVKVKGQIGQTGHCKKEGEFSYTEKGEFLDTIKKRVCQSCGRDITNQNRGSKFCSARFVGEAAAHQCRNKNSNPRNNFKNKIRRIKSKGILFDIGPFIIQGEKQKTYQKEREKQREKMNNLTPYLMKIK